MYAIEGGFEFSDSDQQLITRQKEITKGVNEGFIQVGAIFLRRAGKDPVDSDWFAKHNRDTNLQDWIDLPECQSLNVGFNLQSGWVDVDLDSPHPEYNRCVIRAMQHLGVDTRLQFGRRSIGCASHVMVQLGEDESKNFDELADKAPKAFKIGGDRYHVELRSTPMGLSDKDVIRSAKQTVMPGSVYLNKANTAIPDISVWYNGTQVITNPSDVFKTTPRAANFSEILRSVAFGTVLFMLRPHWTKGNRQNTAIKVCGWLARVVIEGAAINNNEVLSRNVWCPVDSIDTAESLLKFVCEDMDDDEYYMRTRTLSDAYRKLTHNPDSKVPGWPSMTQMLGDESIAALRTVLSPGTDVSTLARLADRYIYNESSNQFIDKQLFASLGGTFQFENHSLELRHRNEVIILGNKPKEAFKMYVSSGLRKHVTNMEMWPDLNPGELYRMSTNNIMVADEDEDPTARVIFNMWRGWPVKPTEHPDSGIMERCEIHLSKLLGYLTRDNPIQMEWIRKWLAYTFQHPGDKQQISWVVIGGKGVGKTWMGNTFLSSLMGPLFGNADSAVLGDRFALETFIGKILVLVDEVVVRDGTALNNVKKLTRNVHVAGQEKFEKSRTHEIYARLMLASNYTSIGSELSTDRAIFVTRAYDKQFLRLTEMQFSRWAEDLKPFFEEFTKFIEPLNVREHFMRYFHNIAVTRAELESTAHSSGRDEDIMLANLPSGKQIVKEMVEEGGNIIPDIDITYPFHPTTFGAKVDEIAKQLGVRSYNHVKLINELIAEGLVEKFGGVYRFRYKIGTLTEKMAEWIGAPLNPRYDFTESDYGDNDCDGRVKPKWKGSRVGVVERSKF